MKLYRWLNACSICSPYFLKHPQAIQQACLIASFASRGLTDAFKDYLSRFESAEQQIEVLCAHEEFFDSGIAQ